jgi:acyl dehydratase
MTRVGDKENLNSMTDELLHYEDFLPGDEREVGSYEITADLIREYASEWDPQPFHLDEDYAAASVLRGLCASGWQVCAIMNRLMVDAYARRAAGMGSFGIEEVKWIKPVYVGDVLTLGYKVLDKRVSRSKPEMGIVRMSWRALDQYRALKTEMIGINLMRVRGAGAQLTAAVQ